MLSSRVSLYLSIATTFSSFLTSENCWEEPSNRIRAALNIGQKDRFTPFINIGIVKVNRLANFRRFILFSLPNSSGRG